VVVPSYNRPERLRDCLDALLVLDWPGNWPGFEIVVVDDGSTEPLAPVCAAFGTRVRCVRQANCGPAAARNAGVRATDAEFVAFTDDDCRPRSGWLTALVAAHGGVETRLVGGRVENGLRHNPYSAASQSLCDYLYAYFGAASGEAPFFTSNNMGCARERFERLGGFDETFPLAAGEDRDFGLRWRSGGGELVLAPEAVVEHGHALDLRRFWRQHANYGRGARHLHRQLDRRGDRRPRIESLRFYIGLIAHPLRGDGRARLAQSALMALSQAAMIQGYLAQALAEQKRAAGESDPHP
jgi:GT2 family glycosyltransferase